jgi:hypothetical protein
VIPLGVANYPGLVIGSFSLLTFPLLETTRVNESPMVFVDGHEGALFLDEEDAVTRYRAALADMAPWLLPPASRINLLHNTSDAILAEEANYHVDPVQPHEGDRRLGRPSRRVGPSCQALGHRVLWHPVEGQVSVVLGGAAQPPVR